jgi:hypothetical protein
VKRPSISSIFPSLAWLFVTAACLGAATARADNAVDDANIKLAARVVALGRSPKAALPLLELWQHWDSSTPSRTLALLQGLATNRRLTPSMRALATTFLAEAETRLGDPDALIKRYDQLGYLSSWRVIGPFDNEGKSGLDTETPPERDRMLAPDLQATEAHTNAPAF